MCSSLCGSERLTIYCHVAITFPFKASKVADLGLNRGGIVFPLSLVAKTSAAFRSSEYLELERALGSRVISLSLLVCTPLHLASACVWASLPSFVWLPDCNQGSCVFGSVLGLFVHWHSWSCISID